MQTSNVTSKCCVSRNYNTDKLYMQTHLYQRYLICLPQEQLSTTHRSEFKLPGLKETPSSSEMNVATALSIRILLFSFHKSTENRIRGQLSWGMRVNWPSLLSLHCALGAWTAHRHFQLERLSWLNLQCTERDIEI